MLYFTCLKFADDRIERWIRAEEQTNPHLKTQKKEKTVKRGNKKRKRQRKKDSKAIRICGDVARANSFQVSSVFGTRKSFKIRLERIFIFEILK